MKKIALIITFLFLSTINFAQDKSVGNISSIKVKAIKPILKSNSCNENDRNKTAIVMEYEVVKKLDRKLYGNKIYVIVPCFDYPSEFSFDGKVGDLEISETNIYSNNFTIINEELLLKNITRKKYWKINLSRKATINCGIK